MASQSEQADYIPLFPLPRQLSDIATSAASALQLRAASISTVAEDEMRSVPLSRQSSRDSLVSVSSSRNPAQMDGPVQQFLLSTKLYFASFFQSFESTVQKRLKRSRFYGWRMGVLFGSCMSAFVLCCNVVVVVIGSQVYSGYDNGIADVKFGGAPSISRWSTFFHLLINAGSTALLAASNYTMQVLCSPTRQDIDNAHSRGMWVDVGLLSFRNIRAIPRKRAILALILAFSSVPLHLL